jgi:hypothetical protein
MSDEDSVNWAIAMTIYAMTMLGILVIFVMESK